MSPSHILNNTNFVLQPWVTDKQSPFIYQSLAKAIKVYLLQSSCAIWFGGSGVDTLSYSGSKSKYTLTKGGSTYTVTNKTGFWMSISK